MAYTRQTRDYWDIEQRTPWGGWEVVSSEVTRRDARQCLRDYRANQPEFPVRSIKRRERIVIREARHA